MKYKVPKLQRIKRSDGSLVHSVNIPLEFIEELEWEKGTELSLEIRKVRGSSIIIIFREEDKLNEKEEENDTKI